MQTHKTKGIVLRVVKYGETSIITTVYTELFGIQSYIVKGIRQGSKKSSSKINYFQPAAILDLEVYHNEFKTLQFIKDYSWRYLYNSVLFDVVRNSVAMFIVEVSTVCLKQPEPNAELFYFIEDVLIQTDKADDAIIANLPLYFVLQMAAYLGFQINGSCNKETALLDLQEGCFVKEEPIHPYFVKGIYSETISRINETSFIKELSSFKLNKEVRKIILQYLEQYIALHINDVNKLKSLSVLHEVL